MKIKEYKRHVYDLELKSMLNVYQAEIKKVELDAPDKTPEYFINLIKFVINDYCNFKGIRFDRVGQVVVLPDAKHAYDQFLGVSLVFYEGHKIQQYLNYQQQQFENISRPQESFIDLVEFVVVDIVKNSSPFDNSKRLEEIMRWVGNEKNQLPVFQEGNSKNTKKIFDPERDFLIWDDKQLLIQSEFSFALSKSGFTASEYDFTKVFQKKRMIGWRKGLQAWVYFMSRLKKDKYITTSKGEVPYLKIGRYYFTICYDRKKINENLQDDLPVILYNVTRSEKKHVNMRQEVDLLYEKVINKMVKK